MSKHRSRGPARRGNPLRGILAPAVRRWLYGIAAAVAPLVTVYGIATDQQAVLWLNLVGALLFTIAVGNTPSRPAEQTPLGADDWEADPAQVARHYSDKQQEGADE